MPAHTRMNEDKMAVFHSLSPLLRTVRTASVLALTACAFGAPLVMAPAQASAQAASPAAAQAAGQFVDGLADKAFAILRDKSMDRTSARAKFRAMLKQNFDVQMIGNKLIRQHMPPAITQAQYVQYQQLFPDYIIGTYADRLYDYANADLKVIRSRPRGTRGDMDVFTRITLSAGAQPIDAIWAVRADASGRMTITNLTVSGVNLTLTQEADFDSYIRRNGFDALLRFMRETSARS